MGKINNETHKALLHSVDIPTSSQFAIEGNKDKNRDYFTSTSLEIEKMVNDYQEQLVAGHKDCMMVLLESKTIYKSIKRCKDIKANIWISYIDSYHIIISCEVITSSNTIAKNDRTLMVVSSSNGTQVQVPKSIIEAFINDHKLIRKRLSVAAKRAIEVN